jgi:hypothetical protein
MTYGQGIVIGFFVGVSVSFAIVSLLATVLL